MDERERMASTFVELADTLVDDFDLVDFLSLLTQRCVELLGVAEVGMMLADKAGNLRFIAASTERARLLELFELQNEEGPCLDCFRSGEQLVNQRLDVSSARWPRFGAEAISVGFTWAHALPLRLRGTVIGAVNMFHSGDRPLGEAEVRLGQAMADIATIGILQERTVHEATILTEQLQRALDSRIIVEQAKGMLAERAKVDVDVSFSLLRGYARQTNRRLADVAAAFLAGEIPAAQLRKRGGEAAQRSAV